MDVKFGLGDIVYFKTDREQLPRMVIGMFFFMGGIVYELSYNGERVSAYEIELTKDKDILIEMNVN